MCVILGYLNQNQIALFSFDAINLYCWFLHSNLCCPVILDAGYVGFSVESSLVDVFSVSVIPLAAAMILLVNCVLRGILLPSQLPAVSPNMTFRCTISARNIWFGFPVSRFRRWRIRRITFLCFFLSHREWRKFPWYRRAHIGHNFST